MYLEQIVFIKFLEDSAFQLDVQLQSLDDDGLEHPDVARQGGPVRRPSEAPPLVVRVSGEGGGGGGGHLASLHHQAVVHRHLGVGGADQSLEDRDVTSWRGRWRCCPGVLLQTEGFVALEQTAQ